MDYLVLLSSIALGAGTVFWLHLTDARRVKVLNAFTGAYLLTLVMLHLLLIVRVVTILPWVMVHCLQIQQVATILRRDGYLSLTILPV